MGNKNQNQKHHMDMVKIHLLSKRNQFIWILKNKLVNKKLCKI